MMSKLLTYITVLGVLVAFMPEGAAAQSGDQGGSAGSSYLLVPGTANTASLGATVTGGHYALNGVEALAANPAGAMLNTGTSVLFSRMEYVADIGVNTFGVAQRLGENNVALTVVAWDIGDIPLTTEQSPEVSDLSYSPTMLQVGLSYARQFTDRIAAGLTVKLLNETIDDMSASGFAFDTGMTYIVGETGLRFGVSLKNFGPQMIFSGDGLLRETPQGSLSIQPLAFELPSELNFGVSYTRDMGSSASATILSNFRSNSYQHDQFSGGLQLGFRNMFFVRGGYLYEEALEDGFFEGWNVGAGLNLEFEGTRLMIDYAYRPTDPFDNVQLITASIVL